MYCAKCGSKLLEGAAFCSKCGTPVNITRDHFDIKEKINGRYGEPTGRRHKPNRQTKLVVSVLIGAIAIAVIVGLFFLKNVLFKGTPDLMEDAWYGNSSENIACGAAFAEKDGIIYFDSPKSSAIYATSQYGTTAYPIIPDNVNEFNNRYLNISKDNYLYYVTGGNCDRIVRLDLSTPLKRTQTIYEIKGSPSTMIRDLTLVDERIYFRVGGKFDSKIYGADKECQSVSFIAQGGAMTVRDGWIYYAGGKNSDSIYRIRSNGSEKEKLYEREGLISSIFVKENTLYYTGIASNSSGCISLDDKSNKELFYSDNNDIIVAMNYCNGSPILFRVEVTDGTKRDVPYAEDVKHNILFKEDDDTTKYVQTYSSAFRDAEGYSVFGSGIYYPASGGQIGFSNEFDGWRDICAYRVNIDSGEGEYILLDPEGDLSSVNQTSR